MSQDFLQILHFIVWTKLSPGIKNIAAIVNVKEKNPDEASGVSFRRKSERFDF